jgi:hypothetical protein
MKDPDSLLTEGMLILQSFREDERFPYPSCEARRSLREEKISALCAGVSGGF